MEIVYDERDARRLHRAAPREVAEPPGAGRPVPRRRRRDRRRRALRRHRAVTSAASWSTSRRPASTPATRPARCRRSRSAAPTSRRIRHVHRGRSPAGSACAACSTSSTPWPADVLYVLEANPRASRTVPFVSEGDGATPLAKAAARVMLGATDRRAARARACCRPTATAARCRPTPPIAVKEAVMPFNRFRTSTAVPSTPCSARRCARPARSWASTTPSGPRSPSRQAAAYGRLPIKGTRVRVAWPTATSVHMIFPVKRAGRPRLRDPGHRGHGRGAAPQRRPRQDRAQAQRGPGPGGEPDERAGQILDGEVDLIVNTPFGSLGQPGPRARRLRDPHGRGAARHPVHHHGRGAAPPRRPASRRSCAATSAYGPCKSTHGHSGADPAREVKTTGRHIGAGDGHGADDAPGRRLPCADGGGARHRRALPSRSLRLRGRRRGPHVDGDAPRAVHPRREGRLRRHGRTRASPPAAPARPGWPIGAP